MDGRNRTTFYKMMRHNKFLFIAISICLIISVGHIIKSSSLILLGIISFLSLILFLRNIDKITMLFFFLPWNGIIKLSPESNSFYGFAIILTVLSLIFFKYSINKKSVMNLIIFVFYTIIVKLFFYDNFSFRFLIIVLNILLILYLSQNQKELINSHKIIIFFSIGTLLANITGNFLAKLPHLYLFFKDSEYSLTNDWGIFRLSGFNGDPNRNALQILFAISVLLLYKTKSVKDSLLKYITLFALIYYGMLTVSKMFYIILILLSILYSFLMFFTKQKRIAKFLYFISGGVFFLIIFYNGLLDSQIDMLFDRIDRNEEFGITTGRLYLQLSYLQYIVDNIQLIFVGRGFLTAYTPTYSVAHNSFIQMFFGLGFIGTFLYLKNILAFEVASILKSFTNTILFSMPFLVLVFSCFALDLLSFDSFYFYIILLIVVNNYLTPLKN